MINRKGEAFDGAAIVVEGLGFIASGAKGKLPDIEFTQFTSMSGVAENTIDTTVLKQMKSTLELLGENKVYVQALKKRKNKLASFEIRYTSSGKQVLVTLRGNVAKSTSADVEIGKENKKTLEITVNFYKKEVDGYVENLIDIDNMICELDGEDIWADQTAFLIG